MYANAAAPMTTFTPAGMNFCVEMNLGSITPIRAVEDALPSRNPFEALPELIKYALPRKEAPITVPPTSDGTDLFFRYPTAPAPSPVTDKV